jgi:hypothetical protein
MKSFVVFLFSSLSFLFNGFCSVANGATPADSKTAAQVPHPFISKDNLNRFLTIIKECTDAQLARIND